MFAMPVMSIRREPFPRVTLSPFTTVQEVAPSFFTAFFCLGRSNGLPSTYHFPFLRSTLSPFMRYSFPLTRMEMSA